MLLKEVTSSLDYIIYKALPAIKEKMEKRFGKPIGEGRTRITYGGKYVVVKIPKNARGLDDNYHEARMSKQGKDPNLAKSKIGHIGDIPILFMTRLVPAGRGDKVPRWADFVDSGQVGKDRKGRWKAYDYGWH